MSSILLQCPSCGREDIDLDKQCVCGFNADESFIAELEKKGSDATKGKSLKNIDEPNKNKHTENLAIKEIDSWTFSFSPVDDCIYLGTQALQSFRLKLTLSDLEELLEFMYHKTGLEKTTRKLKLSAKEISELIDKVNTIIEEKKSKIIVKFSDDELQKIGGLINTKLKV
ncbi:MAG: hypothetical protein ABFR82_02590 [Nitrospirota bacterium]